MTTVHYRYATVQARRLFYREAGPRATRARLAAHHQGIGAARTADQGTGPGFYGRDAPPAARH
ncbi:MAG TPA: hypothetical protein VFC19_44750 [Candidatus Limnocylindrales bacterium]|nr:hypothetical protein [Candidatus Limnocylindrales bacterium]